MDLPQNHIEILDFINLGKIENGILKMPTLWIMDKSGKYRYWNLSICIINPDSDEILEITNDYIDRDPLPDGFIGAYWTESGVEHTENPIISEKKYVETGKNLNSKNYTTAFTQAVRDAKTDFNHRIRKGAVLKKNVLSNDNTSMEELMKQTHRGNYPWRVFPMALHDINKANNWRHIKYPCIIQPKLDGTMFVIVYDPLIPTMKFTPNSKFSSKDEDKDKSNGKDEDKDENLDHIDAYSRGKENYNDQEHIMKDLYKALKNYPGLHLVGELWKKGYGLQDISGSSRRAMESKIKSDKIQLDYYIFDCFYIDEPSIIFRDREMIIKDIISEVKSDYVKYIGSNLVKTQAELMDKYQSYLLDGMEGAVVRNLNSLHEIGINKEQRSYQTLKLKPRPDAEWPVIGFKDGKGKESDAVIWICAETDEGVSSRLNIGPKGIIPDLSERMSFNVTPNMDYETRYAIFKALNTNKKMFKDNLYGKMLTINYSILSKDLLPQQPKAIRFRDSKTDLFVTSL